MKLYNEHKLAAFLVLVAVLFCPALSSAAEKGGNRFAGILSGVGFPSSSSNAFTYAVTAGYKLTEKYGVGLFFQRYTIGLEVISDNNVASVNSANTLYGAEGNYYIKRLPGLVAGVRLGLANTALVLSATDGTTTISINNGSTRLLFGLKLGYDYFFSAFSLGGELSYFYGLGEGAPRALCLLGVFKFWI